MGMQVEGTHSVGKQVGGIGRKDEVLRLTGLILFWADMQGDVYCLPTKPEQLSYFILKTRLSKLNVWSIFEKPNQNKKESIHTDTTLCASYIQIYKTLPPTKLFSLSEFYGQHCVARMYLVKWYIPNQESRHCPLCAQLIRLTASWCFVFL